MDGSQPAAIPLWLPGVTGQKPRANWRASDSAVRITSGRVINLAQESRAEAIYFNQNYSPYDVQVENHLKQAARQAGIEVFAFTDTVVLSPDEVLNQSGQPFRVFTPYARAWHQRIKPDPLPKVNKLKTGQGLITEPVPTLKHWGLQPEATVPLAGEKAAQERLKAFSETPFTSTVQAGITSPPPAHRDYHRTYVLERSRRGRSIPRARRQPLIAPRRNEEE